MTYHYLIFDWNSHYSSNQYKETSFAIFILKYNTILANFAFLWNSKQFEAHDALFQCWILANFEKLAAFAVTIVGN